MEQSRLVTCHEYGIQNSNYYWAKRHDLGISDEELARVGITSDSVLIDIRVASRLKTAICLLRARGYTVTIKEGYRSPEAYALISRVLSTRKGEAFAFRLNLIDMPHASGLAIDVALVSLDDAQEVRLHVDEDGPGAAFAEFYRNRTDTPSLKFQHRQDVLHQAMFTAGFVLGSKKEVWHFELPA